MLLVACVPSNTTSTAETSDIISDTDTSNSESKAQIPPTKAISKLPKLKVTNGLIPLI